MKKVLVLNTLDPTIDKSCCNVFKKVNWLKCMFSSKQYHENTVTEQFNKIGSNGFVFQDEKVLPHNLYVENEYDSKSVHGVYRFTNAGSARYQVYFGPIIEVTQEDLGCLTGLGCNPKMGCKGMKLGCKGSKLGCKNLSCSSLGCSSKGGNVQYVNFMNNEKNQEPVKALNKHFNLRESFEPEKDDYTYSTITENSLNELVKDHYERILTQYTQDVESFYQQGLGYIKTLDTPSFDDLFTQAMLFGSTSNQKALMADLSTFQANIRLSRFDVWYFPMIKGLLRRIGENIPIIKWFFSKEEIIATSRLNESNRAFVESVYEEEFNATEDKEIITQMVKEAIVGKIPVTLAVKRKLGFWKSIFHPVEYDFHTYMIDAIQG